MRLGSIRVQDWVGLRVWGQGEGAGVSETKLVIPLLCLLATGQVRATRDLRV
jgi:hypothetical protein